MRGRASALALLAVAASAVAGCDGCSRRKPLPRGPDAGPAVELVDRQVGPAVQVVSQPLIEEHEPDDDRDHAQPLEPGKGIRGTISAGGPGGKTDEDWYSYLVQDRPAGPGIEPGGAPAASAPTVPGPAGGPGGPGGPGAPLPEGAIKAGGEERPQELRLKLVPGAGADLALEVLDGDGRRLAHLDEKGAGETEGVALVQRLGQTVYLRVRPSSRQRTPLAGEAASYQLLLEQGAAPGGSEIEPNDTPQQAQEAHAGPLPAEGVDLSGQLWSKKDEDWFALTLDGTDGGVLRGTILRLDLGAPGLTPALRVLGEGGAPILDVRATGEELRLRNVGLPPGARRVLIGVRAAAWKRPEGRYQLRAAVEPPLDGAEQEPNDRCEQASALPAAGEVAGFLWPGDEDCYRLLLPGPSLVSLRLAQAEECQAELQVPGEPAGKGPQRELSGLRRSGELLVRVVGRPRKGCFDAPYRLQAQVSPESGAPP